MNQCEHCKATGVIPHALNCPDCPKNLDGFRVENMTPFEPGVSVFHQDAYHMGDRLAKDIMLMYPNHDHEEARYLIIIDEKTGKRIKVTFDREEKSKISAFAREHGEMLNAYEKPTDDDWGRDDLTDDGLADDRSSGDSFGEGADVDEKLAES